MTRLVRAVDASGLDGVTMTLAGEHGAVVLCVSLGGFPPLMALHSPVPRDGWGGPGRCRVLETGCWSLSADPGGEPGERVSWPLAQAEEEALWAVMEHGYRAYLERSPSSLSRKAVS